MLRALLDGAVYGQAIAEVHLAHFAGTTEFRDRLVVYGTLPSGSQALDTMLLGALKQREPSKASSSDSIWRKPLGAERSQLEPFFPAITLKVNPGDQGAR